MDDQATYPYDSNNNDAQGETVKLKLHRRSRRLKKKLVLRLRWKARSKIYIEFLLKHVGLHESSGNAKDD